MLRRKEFKNARGSEISMTCTDWINYIQDTYGAPAEHPWQDKPEFAVFRHKNNKKWFALFMTVKASRLGLPGDEDVPVLNLKADPRLIGSQREEPGFFPAYHMNKEHWITAALDRSAAEDEIKALLAMSYDLTASKKSIGSNTASAKPKPTPEGGKA